MNIAARAVDMLTKEALLAQEQARKYQIAAEVLANEARIAQEAAAVVIIEANRARVAAEELLNSSLDEPIPDYDFEKIVKRTGSDFSKA